MALVQLKVFPYVNTANYLLAVIPLFIIMGHFGFKAGISRDLYTIGREWFSRFPGGLGIATFVASAGFGACCGSSVASAATMRAIAIPEMRALGYDRKLACGLVAAAGTLAIMIPPSVVSVFYASINDTSAGAQLIQGRAGVALISGPGRRARTPDARRRPDQRPPAAAAFCGAVSKKASRCSRASLSRI